MAGRLGVVLARVGCSVLVKAAGGGSDPDPWVCAPPRSPCPDRVQKIVGFSSGDFVSFRKIGVFRLQNRVSDANHLFVKNPSYGIYKR